MKAGKKMGLTSIGILVTKNPSGETVVMHGIHERDLLAANNIKRFGLKDQNLITFTAGTVG